MSKKRFKVVDTICCRCGNIQVYQIKIHEYRLSKEVSKYCYMCKKDTPFIIINEQAHYLSYIADKERNNAQLTDNEIAAATFLRCKKKKSSLNGY
ncbi:MAG: hypothetical protein IJR82_02970 [Bacilli bacterium]|nr:hypothetical protein [Bacilli bacterium]